MGRCCYHLATLFLLLWVAEGAMAQDQTILSKDASVVTPPLALQVPGLPATPQDIEWDRLPLLRGDQITVFEGEENVTAFNHYPTIVYFHNRFFASWGNGNKDEDASGQKVMYATSKDGRKWTKATTLMDGTLGKAYRTSGYWIRHGALFAIASELPARYAQSDYCRLWAYQWNEQASKFETPNLILEGFFATNGPQQTGDGRWLMPGRPLGKGSGKLVHGDGHSLDAWSFRHVPQEKITHDTFWYTLPDGRLALIEADGVLPDRRVIIRYSADKGESWTDPEISNFPDADSRLHGLRLSNGRYVLLNNPNLERYRIPLSIAVSTDGLTFDRMANVRIEQTNKRYSGESKAPGYQYVRAIEHDKRLWVIYSVNKEDIEITSIPLSEIDRLYASDYRYDGNSKPGKQIIVDNTDSGFTTDAIWPTDTTVGEFRGFTMGFHGANYSYHDRNGGTTRGWAKWTPDIDEPGTYAVYMKWATIGFGTRSRMSDIARLEIKHADGVRQSSVDQTRYGGTWISLGTYQFDKGQKGYVKIFASGKEITVADAVKFVRMD